MLILQRCKNLFLKSSIIKVNKTNRKEITSRVESHKEILKKIKVIISRGEITSQIIRIKVITNRRIKNSKIKAITSLKTTRIIKSRVIRISREANQVTNESKLTSRINNLSSKAVDKRNQTSHKVEIKASKAVESLLLPLLFQWPCAVRSGPRCLSGRAINTSPLSFSNRHR